MNDENFQYDNNAPECIAARLNIDLNVEEAHEAEIEHETDSDHLYDPSFEKLHTDYSLGEANNIKFLIFNEENEVWDPQFEVGKIFKDILQFRKAIKNHRVAMSCNLRLKTNDDKRVQTVRMGVSGEYVHMRTIN
ncbi:Uncharacterized protein Adt_14438 [Abeliophyllum distichum]|uniref:Uncharacterized protein n=1 Tax=Abeliophyllum distichum TaxID=126358 RepID=A0ABD1TZM9_9LAMI